MQQSSMFGLLVGLILGAAVAFGGFGELLIVAFFGALGVIVVKIIEGEIDLSEVLSPRNRRRR